MKKWTMAILVILLALPMAASAQEDQAEGEGGWNERIRKIAEVITRSEEAREAGVPEEDVKVILEETRKRQLPPEETEEILVETTEAVKESGPVDNFGAFVQAQLDEGLRGRDLAAAIHEEHRLHGKGKGHGKDKAHGKGHDKGHGKGHGKNKDGQQSDDGHEGHDHDNDDHDDHDDHEDDDEGHGKGKNKKGKGNGND